MTGVRDALDFSLDLVTSGLWALAAFFIGARLLSPSAGMLLAFAVFITALTFILTTRSQERRARNIAAGACPRCRATLSSHHEHRRWDPAGAEWLPPFMTWQCEVCGFQQEAPIACEACPAGV